MEKMRAEIQGRLSYWRRICALFAILVVTNSWNYFRPMQDNESFISFFQGFQLGIALAFLAGALSNIVRFRNILKEDEAVRKYYIKVHDERCAAIEAKSGGTVLYTCGVLIIGVSIIAGYFNPIVFVALLACGVFLLLVKKGLSVYYCKKM